MQGIAISPLISMCYLLKQAFSQDWRRLQMLGLSTWGLRPCNFANDKGFDENTLQLQVSGGRLLHISIYESCTTEGQRA
jgi:hypothetical protein